MRLTVPLPSDIYEVTATVTGTAGLIALLGGAKATSAGVSYWPLVQSVTLDGTGTASVTFVAAAFAPAGSLSVGATLTWSPAPSGLNSTATVTACALAPSGRFARYLARLVGPAWQAKDGNVIAEVLRAVGALIANAEATLQRAVAQIFVDSATDMLSEWERRLGLAEDPYSPATTRQAHLLARWRARAAGTAQRIREALFPIDLNNSITEGNSIDSQALGDERRTFLFAVVLSLALFSVPDTVARVRALVDVMKPAYTDYNLTNQIGFLTDDPNSLTDLTVLSS